MAANPELSCLALTLLSHMADQPDRIEYNTRVLGGMFRDEDVARLDSAYEELVEAGLVERSGQIVSFFGSTKALCKITPEGERHAAERRAAS